MGTSLTELRLFLHKVSFTINALFPTFRDMFYACRFNTLCWSVGALHARRVSVHRRPQNSILGVRPWGGQKNGSRRVLIRDWREYDGEQSTPVSHLPSLCAFCCAVWRHAGGRLDSSSCLAEPFEFVVLTSLMSSHTALNLLWHLFPRIPLTRFLYCPRRR
jgi:hypothetical protein